MSSMVVNDPWSPGGGGTAEETRTVIRRIKYEHQLDHGFGGKIADAAYGERLFGCIQCGTCSATCPLSHYMDFTPRRIIAMTREGFKDEVLHSATIWLCASCYSCTVQCPRDIHITDVMYALKREAIAHGVYPRRFPIPVLAREFFNQVTKEGRNSESRLLVRLYAKTNPFAALKNATLGIKLFLKGRMPLAAEFIKDKPGLRKLMEAAGRRAKEARS